MVTIQGQVMANKFALDTLNTAHTERVNSTLLVEMRKYPRYATRLEAVAVSSTGASTVATVIDLSAGGLRLQLDQAGFTTLLPGDNPTAAHDPADLTVHFNLPGDPQQPPSVSAECLAVHSLSGSNGMFQVGVSFKSVVDGKEELRRYLKYRKDIARC